MARSFKTSCAKLAGTLCLSLGACSSIAKALEHGIGGHEKLFPTLQEPILSLNPSESSDRQVSLFSELRLKGYLTVSAHTAIEWAYGLELAIHDRSPSTFLKGLAKPSYRLVDLNNEIWQRERGRVSLHQNLDRLLAKVSWPSADLSIGRQAFAYGVGRVSNPTDVFLPFAFQTINREYRRGLDGIRLLIPLGDVSEAEFSYIFGEDAKLEESAQLARIKFPLSTSDIELLLLRFYESPLFGLNFQSSLVGAGIRMEVAKVWPKEELPYLRATAGLDYMFPSGFLMFAEYHYNGPGKALFTPKSFAQLTLFPYRYGAVFFFQQHYLATGFHQALTPLLSAQLQSIVSLDDRSFILHGHGEYNFAENFYVDGGLLVGSQVGKENRSNGEFSHYPSSIYLSLRHYW